MFVFNPPSTNTLGPNKIAEKATFDHIRRDEKNGFSGLPYLPQVVRKFQLRNRPTLAQVPANPDAGTSVTISDVVKQETTHHVSNPSISSTKQHTTHTSKLAASDVS